MKSVEERNKLNGLIHKWRVTLMFHHIKPHYYHTLIERAPNHTYQLMKNQAGKSKKYRKQTQKNCQRVLVHFPNRLYLNFSLLKALRLNANANNIEILSGVCAIFNFNYSKILNGYKAG